MGESWYLACDFQLFLLGPWIMLIISKLKKPMIYAFLTILMIISCAIPGVLTGLNNWPPQNFASIIDESWQNEFYERDHL